MNLGFPLWARLNWGTRRDSRVVFKKEDSREGLGNGEPSENRQKRCLSCIFCMEPSYKISSLFLILLQTIIINL